ncbi:hypothetical protein [Escherichia coli]|nr:hypothetical protein [Escherichia coli]
MIIKTLKMSARKRM